MNYLEYQDGVAFNTQIEKINENFDNFKKYNVENNTPKVNIIKKRVDTGIIADFPTLHNVELTEMSTDWDFNNWYEMYLIYNDISYKIVGSDLYSKVFNLDGVLNAPIGSNVYIVMYYSIDSKIITNDLLSSTVGNNIVRIFKNLSAIYAFEWRVISPVNGGFTIRMLPSSINYYSIYINETLYATGGFSSGDYITIDLNGLISGDIIRITGEGTSYARFDEICFMAGDYNVLLNNNLYLRKV